MNLTEEQSKLKALLTEAITVLCKNGISFFQEVTVEGLLGITTDNQDVFLISLNELIKPEAKARTLVTANENVGASPVKSAVRKPGPRNRKRLHDVINDRIHASNSAGSISPLRISAVTSLSELQPSPNEIEPPAAKKPATTAEVSEDANHDSVISEATAAEKEDKTGKETGLEGTTELTTLGATDTLQAKDSSPKVCTHKTRALVSVEAACAAAKALSRTMTTTRTAK